jgi:outer membrane protein assembly factor BamB
MNKHKTLGLTALCLWPMFIFAAPKNNWAQFRGPGALGVSSNPGLPEKWSPTENVLWKQEIPGRGWSSPVVWGNRIFLTTAMNEGKTEEPKKGLYFGGERKATRDTHHWKVLCMDL